MPRLLANAEHALSKAGFWVSPPESVRACAGASAKLTEKPSVTRPEPAMLASCPQVTVLRERRPGLSLGRHAWSKPVHAASLLHALACRIRILGLPPRLGAFLSRRKPSPPFREPSPSRQNPSALSRILSLNRRNPSAWQPGALPSRLSLPTLRCRVYPNRCNLSRSLLDPFPTLRSLSMCLHNLWPFRRKLSRSRR